MSIAKPDRRDFLIRLAGGVGGVSMATLFPVSLLQASEACRQVTTPLLADACGDWVLDDMCNAFPGYAFDMRASQHRDTLVARVADADLMWGA